MKEVRKHSTKAKTLDYRLQVLRTLASSMKEAKSFTQQKLATKLKRVSAKLRSNPADEKARKALTKLEKKIQFIKSVNGKETRAAAFVYSKFDFELNFDAVAKQVSEIVERDVSSLTEEVFEQLQQPDLPKKPYLLFYQLIKQKPNKRFEAAVAKAQGLLDKIQLIRSGKKIKKQSKFQRKTEQKKKAAEPESTAAEAQEAAQSAPVQSNSKAFPAKRAQQGQSRSKTVEVENAGPSHHRYIEKRTDKNRKQRDRQSGFERKLGAAQRAPAARKPDPTQDLHPSYLSKKLAREEQKNVKFAGEIVDL